MAKARRRTRQSAPATWDTVRELVQALPEVEEGTSYGTPAFKVRGKLFVRLHQSGDSLVIMIDLDERAMRMRVDPETFYITDHYRDYPAMLVRLATVSPDDLEDLLKESWRRRAPARVLDAYDKSQN